MCRIAYKRHSLVSVPRLLIGEQSKNHSAMMRGISDQPNSGTTTQME